MYKRIEKCFYLICLLALASCAQTGKVKLNSAPDQAQVSLKTSGGETILLGKTPFQEEESTVFKSSRMGVLTVSKDGYEDQTLFLSRSYGGDDYEIYLKLKPLSGTNQTKDGMTRQERLAIGIAKANTLIGIKKLDEAEMVLKNLLQDFSDVSVCHDLLGNVAYLKRDLRLALSYYEKSVQLNPDKVETKQIVQKLRAMTQ